MSQSTFINALTSGNACTWNGAVSNSTTGSSILDYFAKCGTYRNRSQNEVDADMASIFAEDPLMALKVVFYNRMITRKPVGIDSVTKVQRGQGCRDEFHRCINWLKRNKPELLYNNLWIIPSVGSWKDLWYDSPSTGYENYLDNNTVFFLIEYGMQLPEHRGLIAKYLPKIKTGRKVGRSLRHKRQNKFARDFCKYMGWTEKDYRLFKSSPNNTAHLWQRQMSANKWGDIDFDKISGKALFNLVSKKGKDHKTTIERHGLESKYIDWIKSKPVAKFTGYVYDLYNAAKDHDKSLVQRYTYNAQFEQLLARAKQDINPELLDSGVLCALDTSGSMSWSANLQGVAPIDICVGLGIFFSKFLKGEFADSIIMFDDKSRIKKLAGDFCDRVDQISNEAIAWGSTNFQSVIDEIVRVRQQNPNIPVEDYPKVLLCISDMQWNGTGTFETNYQMLMKKLASVGLPPITCIWWVVNGNGTTDFPSKLDDVNAYMISGFDPSIVTSILGAKKIIDKTTGEEIKPNAYEIMIQVLDQEILNLLTI
jgi:hypothetical protein